MEHRKTGHIDILSSEEVRVGRTRRPLVNRTSQNHLCSTQGAATMELKVLGSLEWQRIKPILCWRRT